MVRSCCSGTLHFKNFSPLWMSIHKTKNILPKKGPAKSRCILCHGCDGQLHGCRGVAGGEFCTAWHITQDFVISSIIESIPGHHTWLLANVLVFDIPRWTLCNSCRTCSCSLAGITTLVPHMTQSSSKVSSVHLFQYVFSVSSTSSGQPCLVCHSTLLNMGSRPITHLSLSDVMGRASICRTVKMSVSGCVLVSVLWSGRCDYASAFAWAFVGWNWILYWCADSCKAHLCSQAAANGGIPLFGPRIVVSGLWSVNKMNSPLYRYWWNFLTTKTSDNASFSN